jgi:flagellar FliL protein
MAEELIATEDSTEVEELEEQAGGRKSRRWMLLIVGFVVLAAGASGALLLYRRTSPAASPEPQQHPVSAVLHLETFTVNLSDPDQKSFLRLGVDLGMDKDPKAANANASTALVRDTILTVLMATKSDDLISTDGKKKLKEDLLHALQERAPELAVQEVYFTDFLLQR